MELILKKGIHPLYLFDSQIDCVCGASMSVGGTKGKVRIEVCSSCHPFFTGKDKFLDSEGMVEKFKKRFNIAPN